MIALLGAIVLSVGVGAAPQDLINQAVQSYRQAMDEPEPATRRMRFAQAKRLFAEAIAQTGVANAELQTNLGNASLQCDELGGAILAYRRALEVSPDHQRARQNLTYARQMLPDWVPRPEPDTLFDTFFAWQHAISPAARSLWAAICFGLTAVLASIAIRYRRMWARNLAILPALVCLALLGTGWWQHWSGPVNDAVITAPEVVARAADAAGAPPRFAQPLPAGTEARLLDQRGDWVRIRLANGRDGWIRRSAITAVRASG